MGIKQIILIWTCCIGSLLTAQKASINCTAALDAQGFTYLIDQKNILVKYSPKGDSIKSVSVSQYAGKVSIDASSPLEIMLFFWEQSKVVVYDNQLNLIWELNLFDKEPLSMAVGFGRAADGNIWLLDKYTRTLKKKDKSGNNILESLMLEEDACDGEELLIFDNSTEVYFGNKKDKIYVFTPSALLSNTLFLQHKQFFMANKDIFTITDTLGNLAKMDKNTRENILKVTDKNIQTIFACTNKQFLYLNYEGILQRKEY